MSIPSNTSQQDVPKLTSNQDFNGIIVKKLDTKL